MSKTRSVDAEKRMGMEHEVKTKMKDWKELPCSKCGELVKATESKKLLLLLADPSALYSPFIDQNTDQHLHASKVCEGSPSIMRIVTNLNARDQVEVNIQTYWGVIQQS